MMEITDEKQCIFCLKSFPELTKEHVIPDAIGGSLTTKKLCKNCNSYLGSKVDTHLTDNLIVGMERYRLGLLGRNQGFKHPFSRGKLANDLEQNVKWTFHSDGSSDMHFDTKVTRKVGSDGIKTISILLDKSREDELGAILESITNREKKAGYEVVPDSYIYRESTIRNPRLQFRNSFDLVGLEQAILKIVYEIAYIELQDSFLDSNIARRLREFIMNESAGLSDLGDIKVRGQMSFMYRFEDMFEFIKSDHLIGLVGNPPKAIYVRIFNFYGALVFIDERPFEYNDIEQSTLIEFDVQNRTNVRLSLSQAIQKHLPGKMEE